MGALGPSSSHNKWCHQLHHLPPPPPPACPRGLIAAKRPHHQCQRHPGARGHRRQCDKAAALASGTPDKGERQQAAEAPIATGFLPDHEAQDVLRILAASPWTRPHLLDLVRIHLAHRSCNAAQVREGTSCHVACTH
eukprot:1158099-Pelagomonas_calceolata.AAC.3